MHMRRLAHNASFWKIFCRTRELASGSGKSSAACGRVSTSPERAERVREYCGGRSFIGPVDGVGSIHLAHTRRGWVKKFRVAPSK
jgi:hypothetical protein